MRKYVPAQCTKIHDTKVSGKLQATKGIYMNNTSETSLQFHKSLRVRRRKTLSMPLICELPHIRIMLQRTPENDTRN